MANELFLPKPGVRISLSPPVNPSQLRGITIHNDDPLRLNFIMDLGDNSSSASAQIKDDSTRLIKYFLAALTTPQDDIWVNLSPYEKNNIVPFEFGQTEMARDLLAQDYVLKQITSSLMYPNDAIGKAFWDKIYAQVKQQYATTDIPVNTFNKVWIVPNKASLYEKGDTVFIVKSSLSVMLESDYLASEKNQAVSTGPVTAPTPLTSVSGAAINDETLRPYQSSELGKLALPVERAPASGPPVPISKNTDNEFSKNIIREIILPALEKEINEGKNFSTLRQVYQSLILAAWYKKKLKDSILAKGYANKNKINGTQYAHDAESKNVEAIYQQYIKSFKKGVFNLIKEDVDPQSGKAIPRKYFSGGFKADAAQMAVTLEVATAPEARDAIGLMRAVDIAVDLTQPKSMPSQSASPNKAMASEKSRKEPVALTARDNEVIARLIAQRRSLYRGANADAIDAKIVEYAQIHGLNYIRITARNQDDIDRLKSTVYVDEKGVEHIIDGPVKKIIKEGGIVLFDYNSDPKLAISFNESFGSEPYLLSQKIPDDVKSKFHVIAVVDGARLKDFSEDMYGRLIDETTHVFEEDDRFTPLSTEGVDRQGKVVIDVLQSPKVRDQLIGTYRLEDGNLTVHPGELIKAISAKQSVIIRNGIWKDQKTKDGQMRISELRLLLRQIQQQKGIYFNNEFYPLPEGFQIYEENTPNFAEGVSSKNIRFNDGGAQSTDTWVINQYTQDMLFSVLRVEGDRITRQDAKPLLEEDALDLTITDDLEEWVWHKIMHAKGSITISVNPGVEVPQAYQQLIRGAIPSTQVNHLEDWDETRDAQVVLLEADDLAFARNQIQQRFPDAHFYPVSPETSSKDLVISVNGFKPKGVKSVAGMKFIGTTKEVITLLKEGKTVVLDGIHHNEVLLRQLEGVLQGKPYIVENGKRIYFSGKLYITAESKRLNNINAFHHVVLEPRNGDLQLASGLSADNFAALMVMREKLKEAGFNVDFSLPRLKRLAKYANLSEGINAIIAAPLSEQAELAAYIRVLARNFFAPSDNQRHIDQTDLFKLLNGLSPYQNWESIFWQMADALSVDALRELELTNDFKQDSRTLITMIQKALIKFYVTQGDTERASFYRQRFKISSYDEEPDLVVLTKPSRLESMVMKAKEALEQSPLLMFIGLQGTGKSHTAREIGELLGKIGPVTTGPDTRERDIVVAEKMTEQGPVNIDEAVSKWANLPEGGVLIIDEGNLPKNGFWNIFMGLFVEGEEPYIWINGQKKMLTKKHKVIITGNPYYFPGRHRHDIIEQYATTIYFEPFSREELKTIMDDAANPYVPMNFSRRDELIDTILDVHFFFDTRAGNGQFSLRDIQELTKRMLKRAKEVNWTSSDVVKEAWGIYKGSFDPEEQEALQEAIRVIFNVDVHALDQQRFAELQQRYGEEFKRRGLALVDANTAIVHEMLTTLDIRQERMDAQVGERVLDGKRGVITEAAPAFGKDVTKRAILDILGFKNALSSDANADPTRNYYELTASLSPQGMIDVVEKAKKEGSIVFVPELNSLDSAFIEGKLNDALTGLTTDGKEVHPGFCLLATINSSDLSGREPLSSALLNRVIYLKLNEYNETDLVNVLDLYNQRQSLNINKSDIQLAVKGHIWVRDHVALARHKPSLRKLEQVLDLFSASQGRLSMYKAFKQVYTPFYLSEAIETAKLPSATDIANYVQRPFDIKRVLEHTVNFLSPRGMGDVRIGTIETSANEAVFDNQKGPVLAVPTPWLSDYPKAFNGIIQASLRWMFQRTVPTGDAEKVVQDFRYRETFKRIHPHAQLPQERMQAFDAWLLEQTETNSQDIFLYLLRLYLNGDIDVEWLNANVADIDRVFDGNPTAMLLSSIHILEDIQSTIPDTSNEEELLYQNERARQLLITINDTYNNLPDTNVEFTVRAITEQAPLPGLGQEKQGVSEGEAFKREHPEVAPSDTAPQVAKNRSQPIIKSKVNLKRALARVFNQKMIASISLAAAVAVGGFGLKWVFSSSPDSKVPLPKVERIFIPGLKSPKMVGIESTNPLVGQMKSQQRAKSQIIKENKESPKDEYFKKLMSDMKSQYATNAIELAANGFESAKGGQVFATDILKPYLMALADSAVDENLLQLVVSKASAFDPELGRIIKEVSDSLRSQHIYGGALEQNMVDLRQNLLKYGVYIEIYNYVNNDMPHLFIYPMPVIETLELTPEQSLIVTRGRLDKFPFKAYVVDDSPKYNSVPNTSLAGYFDGNNAIALSTKSQPMVVPNVSWQWTMYHELMHGAKTLNFRLYGEAVGNNPELDSVLAPIMFVDKPQDYYMRTIRPLAAQANEKDMYSQAGMAITYALEQGLKRQNINISVDDWMQQSSSEEIHQAANYIYSHPETLGEIPNTFVDGIDYGNGISTAEDGGPSVVEPQVINVKTRVLESPLVVTGEDIRSLLKIFIVSLLGIPYGQYWWYRKKGKLKGKYNQKAFLFGGMVFGSIYKDLMSIYTKNNQKDDSTEDIPKIQAPNPRKPIEVTTEIQYTLLHNALRRVSKQHPDVFIELFYNLVSRFNSLPNWSPGLDGLNVETLMRTGDVNRSKEDSLRPVREFVGLRDVYLKGDPDKINPIIQNIARLLKEKGLTIRYLHEDYTEEDLRRERNTQDYIVMDDDLFAQLFEVEYLDYLFKEEQQANAELGDVVREFLADLDAQETETPQQQANREIGQVINEFTPDGIKRRIMERRKKIQAELAKNRMRLSQQEAFQLAGPEIGRSTDGQGALSLVVVKDKMEIEPLLRNSIKALTTQGFEIDLNQFPNLESVTFDTDNMTINQIAGIVLKHPNWRRLKANYPFMEDSISFNELFEKIKDKKELNEGERVLIRFWQKTLEQEQEELRRRIAGNGSDIKVELLSAQGIDEKYTYYEGGLDVTVDGRVIFSEELEDLFRRSHIARVFITRKVSSDKCYMLLENKRGGLKNTKELIIDIDYEGDYFGFLNGNTHIEELHLLNASAINFDFLFDMPYLRALSLKTADKEVDVYDYFDIFPRLQKITVSNGRDGRITRTRYDNLVITQETLPRILFESLGYQSKISYGSGLNSATITIPKMRKDLRPDPGEPLIDSVGYVDIEEGYHGNLREFLLAMTHLKAIAAPLYMRDQLQEIWRKHPNRHELLIRDNATENVMRIDVTTSAEVVDQLPIIAFINGLKSPRAALQAVATRFGQEQGGTTYFGKMLTALAKMPGAPEELMRTVAHELEAADVITEVEREYDDNAMSTKGGIDFNPDKINLDIQSDKAVSGKAISFDQAKFDEFMKDGLMPVIVEVKPITDLVGMLGLQEAVH